VTTVRALGDRARRAARALARTAGVERAAALTDLAARLVASSGPALAANALEIRNGRAAGLEGALLDRLMLDAARLAAIAADVRTVAALPDPVGETFAEQTLPNGLAVRKVRVPLGVLGVIYEARPNVTIDVAALAIRSGNAVILRGGSETLHTNRELVALVRASLEAGGLPMDAVQFIDDPDRARVLELLRLHEAVDLIIPRGGAALHRFCRDESRVPVITGGIGICHLFVDASADHAAALAILRNAKVQRPTVCNALDTALVHREIAAEFLPALVDLLGRDGVTFRVDPAAMAHLAQDSRVRPAGPEDFDTEWLSLVLGIRVVDSLAAACQHIEAHASGHSDGILSRDSENIRRFLDEVDSAAVYANASTRFTDGAQLGLGAEVAISTQRLHARGPMGLRELTTYKWVIEGSGQVRE
jgi:glutamate-5-semialdehyde dehydrogenase